jgi:predicted nucleic acid-binding protein
MMSEHYLLDTSVLIDHMRTNRFAARIEALDEFSVSTVVLSELWRGARPLDRKFLIEFENSGDLLTPSESDWIESGEVLFEASTKLKHSAEKIRDLHFDVLIALTARSHGATVVTTNAKDFTLIRRYREFGLETW